MTDQSTGPLPKPHAEAPVLGREASIGETQPLAIAAVLTMSRGTRPLTTRRLASGNQHGPRRRSA